VAFDKKLLNPNKNDGKLFRKNLDKDIARLDALEKQWEGNNTDEVS
jgi:hypothetical protein